MKPTIRFSILFSVLLNHAFLRPAQSQNQNPLIPVLMDFEASSDRIPGNLHRDSHVATSKNNFMIVWSDKRNGHADIFGRLYSNGVAASSNIRVNDVFNGKQESPVIAARGENYVFAWVDIQEDGDADIYGKIFGNGNDFKISQAPLGSQQTFPAITANTRGEFIVAWQDDRNGNNDIYGQRFDSTGTAHGGNFEVNDDQQGAEQTTPVISMNNRGEFVIAWIDERDGGKQLFAQMYDSSGDTLRQNFKIKVDSENDFIVSPDIALDDNGRFVVVWEEVSDVSIIVGQLYGSNGQPLGDNFIIGSDIPEPERYKPRVTMQQDGSAVIVWWETTAGRSGIWGQRYAVDGDFMGDEIDIFESSGSYASTDGLDAAINANNEIMIAWTDRNTPEESLFGQLLDPSNVPIGNSFKVNRIPQGRPTIGVQDSNKFIIVWEDGRNNLWC